MSELQKVVGDADYCPLASDLIEATQQALEEASALLQLPEYRLDHLFSEPAAAPPAGPL